MKIVFFFAFLACLALFIDWLAGDYSPIPEKWQFRISITGMVILFPLFFH